MLRRQAYRSTISTDKPFPSKIKIREVCMDAIQVLLDGAKGSSGSYQVSSGTQNSHEPVSKRTRNVETGSTPTPISAKYVA